MASQTQGIQQLLQAEKRAAEKVGEARKRKNNRLKQAKKEAEVEINNYKAERERQYKEYEAKILGSRGDMEKKIDETTKVKLREVDDNVRRNREQAIGRLMDVVFKIEPQLHINLRL